MVAVVMRFPLIPLITTLFFTKIKPSPIFDSIINDMHPDPEIGILNFLRVAQACIIFIFLPISIIFSLLIAQYGVNSWQGRTEISVQLRN